MNMSCDAGSHKKLIEISKMFLGSFVIIIVIADSHTNLIVISIIFLGS